MLFIVILVYVRYDHSQQVWLLAAIHCSSRHSPPATARSPRPRKANKNVHVILDEEHDLLYFVVIMSPSLKNSTEICYLKILQDPTEDWFDRITISNRWATAVHPEPSPRLCFTGCAKPSGQPPRPRGGRARSGARTFCAPAKREAGPGRGCWRWRVGSSSHPFEGLIRFYIGNIRLRWIRNNLYNREY